jgi:hypothetical protein
MDESHSTGNHHGGHETRDANPRGLAWFGGCMALALFMVSLSMWLLFNFFAGHQKLGPPASPFAQGQPMPAPDVPRLQVAPSEDLEHMLGQQSQMLNSYGWVDQKSGVVRIPISRAMDLLMQRGLPVRSSKPESPGSDKGQRQTAQAAVPSRLD